MAALNIGLDTISDFLKGIPELGVVNKLTPNSKKCAACSKNIWVMS